MKSTSGNYYVGLDHVRAVAIFMVFTWHFLQVNGHSAPPPRFPLSLLSEGHTGVALFMTLSGYLFAKLLDGRNINYVAFLWNRFLRLAPMLILVILLVGFEKYLSGSNLFDYMNTIIAGAIYPSIPNGGWSITVEFHFYLLLPFLLLLSRRSEYLLILVLMAAVIARVLLYQELGGIQRLSYLTIVGRIDQFLLGIMAYQFRRYFTGKHIISLSVFALFAVFYWNFDRQGGFFKSPSYPSPSSIWIYMPTIEGLAYASLISWYDNSIKHSTGYISRFVASIGTYSYSIYLLHFFIVFRISSIINEHIIDLHNTHLAILFSALCFLLMVPIGYVSYRFVESPFLKLRSQYIISSKAPPLG